MLRNFIYIFGILGLSLISITAKSNQILPKTNSLDKVFQELNVVVSEKNNIKTDTIHVEGNCGMCKDRIENAASIKGVKKATWDKNKHQLIVVYDVTKTNNDLIQKAVAAVGHDTHKYKANAEVYNRLPKCCAYREEGAKVH